MKQLCIEKGWEIFTEYIDDENSYKMWTQLFRDVELEQFDILLIWCFKDFVRIDRDNFHALNKLIKHNVGWHSYNEEIFSTENLNAQRMLDYLNLFSTVGKKKRSVGTLKGQEDARHRNVRIGRSKIPKEAREQIIELSNKGFSFSQIKKAVSYQKSNGEIVSVSVGTIHNVLKNETTYSKNDSIKLTAPRHEFHSKKDDENLEVKC